MTWAWWRLVKDQQHPLHLMTVKYSQFCELLKMYVVQVKIGNFLFPWSCIGHIVRPALSPSCQAARAEIIQGNKNLMTKWKSFLSHSPHFSLGSWLQLHFLLEPATRAPCVWYCDYGGSFVKISPDCHDTGGEGSLGSSRGAHDTGSQHIVTRL